MQSLILQEPGRFEWTDTSEPDCRADEALVLVRRCGVCGTDIHAYAGKQPFFSYPRRLGHELAVEILAAPSNSGLAKGDHCAVEAYDFCGVCPACRAGKTNCCHRLSVLGVHVDGGHTIRMAIPTKYLHKSDSLDWDQLALVEPLVIGAHAVERASITPHDRVVILGMGPIGLATALFAKASKCNLTCIDLNADRLSFATETMNLGTPIRGGDGRKERLIEHLGQLPNVIIDATGNQRSMDGCFDLAEHGGRIVFVGLFIGDLTIHDPNFHRRELTLLASRAGTSESFADVIRQMENGSVDALPLITHRIAFAELADRLPTIHQEPRLVKAMIDFE
ncbi:putative L-galactonate oxidoreductase [Planctomycetes bacterium CA13]|uniref:Putative L-galactonate oxidoreductase n=1 Tax=Novipirellula herctigrandis TaxID=2527986 RepID=A0A5C5Z584_9BACT|nr:putative L-galactonate oxidoreductase [Planctomycetes bacterium CA13]